jgi:hypothetical protein
MAAVATLSKGSDHDYTGRPAGLSQRSAPVRIRVSRRSFPGRARSGWQLDPVGRRWRA